MKAIFSVLFPLVILCAEPAQGNDAPGAEVDDWVYLDNGTLRLGVVRSSGAAIAWLSPSGSSDNLLDHYDRGRLVQQSYYGDNDESLWNGNPWCYNPVQGGDYQGRKPVLLELRSDDTTLYSKSIPLHWAAGTELPECIMEQWIHLEGDIVRVRFQMSYNGTKKHAARHQEVPAVFLDASLDTLVAYSGDEPWTGDKVSSYSPGEKNEYHKITENWAAYVDHRKRGVGVYVPIANDITCYRFRGGSGSDCSYVAPIVTFALEPGLKFEYEAYFALGDPESLRGKFSKIRESLEKKE